MSVHPSLPPKLIYVKDSQPGIRREVCGRGFTYFLPSGRRLRSKKRKIRIKDLGIPPAWKSVWICAEPHGHLQATGLDAASRKQYIYHAQWVEYSKKIKYERLVEFGNHLPQIRKQYREDLKHDEWDKRRVLALATALLDELYLRVGNARYTDRNSTYGLTTLRRKHLDFEDGVALLNYKAKRGKERSLSIKDETLKKMLRECSELPGYEIFRYKTKSGFESITSIELNEYLNQLNRDIDFSAKDFRTWGANCLALQKAEEAKEIIRKNPRRKIETTLVKLVAREMGNTVVICRKYYLHPKVIEAACVSKFPEEFKESTLYYDPEERWLLDILK